MTPDYLNLDGKLTTKTSGGVTPDYLTQHDMLTPQSSGGISVINYTLGPYGVFPRDFDDLAGGGGLGGGIPAPHIAPLSSATALRASAESSYKMEIPMVR